MSKLGKRTDQRMAMLKNQVSELLWYGQIETTVDRAKAVRSLTEKYITIAMRAYQDDVKVTKTVDGAKGTKQEVVFTNDGPKKLAARRRLMAELPFMATENIMMSAVKKGGDRQVLHERIREYSMVAGRHVKEDGLENDLCDMILNDEMFMINKEELDAILKPENFTGRSSEQVTEFLETCVKPVLDANADKLNETAEINV